MTWTLVQRDWYTSLSAGYMQVHLLTVAAGYWEMLVVKANGYSTILDIPVKNIEEGKEWASHYCFL